MYADMNRCPQTAEEFRDYVYTLIGQQLGAPADDYEAVFSALYPWQGQMLMIPPGVGPGIKQVAGAPFFGLTQQYSGGPKARVFLPTQTPDDLGYYTLCEQYVDDAAHTLSAQKKQPAAQATGLVWAWYVAGPPNTYVPIQGPDVGGGTTPVPSDLEPRVAALEAAQTETDGAIDTLTSRVTALEAQLAGGLHAHGPVNLPIVVESLTSMRAKGDIDVEVKTGVATPPVDTGSGDGPNDELATIVVLKKLIARRDKPTDPPAEA